MDEHERRGVENGDLAMVTIFVCFFYFSNGDSRAGRFRIRKLRVIVA